ncbi:hypothetical protein OsI_37647 [Oryza sativa Indica Group]|uniref:Uncharacterized protein n=1 Tax=Oryza sativa subsp. indica TaxID=39946 RepID=B8BNF0_ORYSI|nr:hypothetical protein OsI_37647 [Oryza sativa Indica Group]
MGGAAPLLPSWRAAAAAWVALCLVPVVLSLAVLWLPLLCCAVAVFRFRRLSGDQCEGHMWRPCGIMLLHFNIIIRLRACDGQGTVLIDDAGFVLSFVSVL